MSESLVTQCPYCQTRFRLSEEQLQAAAGNVRCGACLRVFSARVDPAPGISVPLTDQAPGQPNPNQGRQPSQLIHDDMLDEDMDLEALGLDESILDEITPPAPTPQVRESQIEPEDPRGRDETKQNTDSFKPAPTYEPEQEAPKPDIDTPAPSLPDPEPAPPAEPVAEPEPEPEPQLEPKPEPELEPLDLAKIDEWPVLHTVEEDDDDDFWAALDAELASHDDSLPELTAKREPGTKRDVDKPVVEENDVPLDLHEDFIASAPARDFGARTEPTISGENDTPPLAASNDQPRPDETPIGPLRPLVDDEADHGVFLRDGPRTRQRSLPLDMDESDQGHRREPGVGNLYALPDLHDEPLYLDAEDRRAPRRKRTGMWMLLCILAAGGLVAQYIYYNFDALARDQQTRSWLESACLLAGCELPARVDISQLRSSNLLVRPHPEFPNALAIDAMLYNRADYAQPFPVLLMQFSDAQGRDVASRRFRPDEYLSGELAGAELMPPQVPIRVALSMLDPGPRAVSYTLEFEPL